MVIFHSYVNVYPISIRCKRPSFPIRLRLICQVLCCRGDAVGGVEATAAFRSKQRTPMVV